MRLDLISRYSFIFIWQAQSEAIKIKKKNSKFDQLTWSQECFVYVFTTFGYRRANLLPIQCNVIAENAFGINKDYGGESYSWKLIACQKTKINFYIAIAHLLLHFRIMAAICFAKVASYPILFSTCKCIMIFFLTKKELRSRTINLSSRSYIMAPNMKSIETCWPQRALIIINCKCYNVCICKWE